MARPSKSVAVIEDEKKSHRTKAEKEARKAAEQGLTSGVKLAEQPKVRADKTAHAEFKRVNKLLQKVGKNDALYEGIINRYCLLKAECADFEAKRQLFSDNLDRLINDGGMEPKEKYRLEAQMQASIIAVDKQIQSKRKMMLDIEKECAMTVASALRSIPKKVEAERNPLLEALMDDA